MTESVVPGDHELRKSRWSTSVGRSLLTLWLTIPIALQAAPNALADGIFATWGYNNKGQLGNSSTVDSNLPVAVTSGGAISGSTILQASTGNQFMCAISTVGSAYCWGKNTNGQLGNGGNTDSSSPVAVNAAGALANTYVTQISAGTSHTCALASDKKAYCWGFNSFGQLGLGTSGAGTDTNTPGAVSVSGVLSGKSLVQISSGWNHSCALSSDGAVFCWGKNSSGELGNGNIGTNSNVPVAVDTSGVLSGKRVIQVAAGNQSTCAITADSAVYCWGLNSYGQLGNSSPTSNNSGSPVAVDVSGVLSGKAIRQVSVGNQAACALSTEGKAYCWGMNLSGTLGNGTNGTGSNIPVEVNSAGVLAGKFVADISVGSQTVCAATSEGKVYCWGANAYGQLGNGTTGSTANDSNVPVAVVTTSNPLDPAFVSRTSSGAFSVSAVAPYGGPGRDLASGTSATWQQMAVACTPSGASTVQDILGSGSPMNLTNADYNNGNAAASQGWVVWGQNAVTNRYVRLALTDTLSRGTGYWLLSYQGGRQNRLIMNCPNGVPSTTVTQAQGCSSANGCFAYTLTTTSNDRGNLVGNPFPYAVDWSAVRVRINGSSTTYTPSQAACASGTCGVGGNAPFAAISNVFYVWNGTSYSSYSDTGITAGQIPYFSSFWVKALSTANGQTVELLIPRAPTQSAVPF